MQTSVANDMTAALEGMVVDSGFTDIISRLVSTQQLDYVLIAGNDDGTFTITIDGTTEATFAASSNTKAQIAADLLSDMADPTADVTAEASGTDGILIESVSDSYAGSNTAFVTTVLSTGTPADITVTTLVAQDQTIPYGYGVCMDDRAAVSGQQIRLPRQATDVTGPAFEGISVRDVMRTANSGNGYANQSSVNVLRRGRIWVQVEDAVAAGGDVYCRYTDPTSAYGLGSFRSDADTSDAGKIPGASYRTAASADGLAQVELSPTA